jgi:hypothetical protein
MKSLKVPSVAILLSICLLILGGCATIDYDQTADTQLTSLTQEIELQLTTWANQAEADKSTVKYDPKFYDKVEADISTLQIRMEATQNKVTNELVGIYKSLRDQLEAMRKLHEKQDYLDAAFLRAELDILNVQIATLTTYELSLKGTSTTTNSTSTATTKEKAKQSNAQDIVTNATKGAGQ